MKKCKVCGNTGIIYDRNIKAGSHGELRVCDHIDEIIEAVQRWYIKQEIVGKKALPK